MLGNSIGEGIANPYDEMNTFVGDELHVNIEQEAGRLFFWLWKYHKWGSFILYYFPVKFPELLNPILRRIAITFIHKLTKANGIDIFMDYEESDFLLEVLSEDDGSDPKERKECMKLLDSYQEGKTGRLLKQVESKSYYKNLPKTLDTYEPQNGFEQPLVDATKRGLPFLASARGTVQYTCDAYCSKNPDFHPMYLQQQIRVVYDINDIIPDYLVDYYSSCSRETYDITPVTALNLSPDTEKLSRMDDYPEWFFRWADGFIPLISRIMLETNEFIQKLRTLLHPRTVLTAYSGEKDDSYASDNNYFVEVRDIDDNGMMGEGRPVTVDFMNELVRGYSESHSITPYRRIPPNMLWCGPCKGNERYIWCNSPQKQVMFLKKSPQVENAKYSLPGVIYVAGGSLLSIYAYEDKKLTEKTELYAAPFLNVTGANVCLGSAKIDKPRDLTYKNLLEYWEKKFWLAEFSHLGGGGNLTRSNPILVTEIVKDRPFSPDELKSLNNLKLKNILK